MSEPLVGSTGMGCWHAWRRVESRLDEGAVYTLYECEGCPDLLRVPPGGAHPETEDGSGR